MTTIDTLTDEQISKLRTEALEAGDGAMVATCNGAEQGDDESIAVVVRAIRDAEANAPQVLAMTSNGVEIEAGDYIVQGDTADDLDCGRVWLDDDGRVMATWESGNGHSPVATHVGETVRVHGVYSSRAAALDAFEERFKDLS